MLVENLIWLAIGWTAGVGLVMLTDILTILKRDKSEGDNK